MILLVRRLYGKLSTTSQVLPYARFCQVRHLMECEPTFATQKTGFYRAVDSHHENARPQVGRFRGDSIGRPLAVFY
jgi:hypothetical protein